MPPLHAGPRASLSSPALRLVLGALLLTGGCDRYELDRDAALDPQSCGECHPDHLREWSGSMHAYASEDPVFLAMNQKGQQETDGELGDFCVGCHAPMAVREGLTEDGLNLDEVPDHLQGVTCAFCHFADGAEAAHNGELSLADDLVMRGGLSDPTANTAHASEHSSFHDRRAITSSEMCGSCHDIVTPAGVHLERTYLEWQQSQYSLEVPGLQQTCGDCHMQGRDDVAADVEGVPLRRVHSHTMVGVDVAITDFPEKEAQAEEIQRALDTTLLSTLDVLRSDDGAELSVTLENVSAGHSWPSGAALDRRAWVELAAYADDAVIWSSGLVEADVPLAEAPEPERWVFGDTIFDDDGEEVHFAWQARLLDSQLLPAPSALAPGSSNVHLTRVWELPGLSPDRVTLRVLLRPMRLDLLEELAHEGYLDANLIERFPTWELAAAAQEWAAED